MRNLKELFCVACISLFFTSCEETYNDKLFWPGEISQEYGSYIKPYTLDLTYSGEKLIGKTVSFKTENSETGTLTLNDVVPGEATTPINNIKLYENEEKGCYTFSGTNITMGGATVKYNGSITPKTMKLDMNVVMANANNIAKSYKFAEYNTQQKINAAYSYVKMSPDAPSSPISKTIGSIAQAALGLILPQILNDIQLKNDGNIYATYSSEELVIENWLKIIGIGVNASYIQSIVDKRTYTPSPENIAFWCKGKENFYIKLNVASIISQITKGSDTEIDESLIAGITEAILKSDPNKLKSILMTLNSVLQNDILSIITNMDNAKFNTFFSWIKDGIPLTIATTDDKHTHIYLNRDALTPIIELLPALSPLIEEANPMGMGSFITQLLTGMTKEWPLVEEFDLGFDFISE